MKTHSALWALCLLIPAVACAQEAYPSRPITMIVPFPPSGVADITGRPTAAALEKVLKQPVTIANRPGAGGAVGNAAVANARPDGYTILMALSSISVIPAADSFSTAAAYRSTVRSDRLISATTLLVVHLPRCRQSLNALLALARRTGHLSFVFGIYAPHMRWDVPAARSEDATVPTDLGRAGYTASSGGTGVTACGRRDSSHVVRKLLPIVSWARKSPAYPIPTFKERVIRTSILHLAGMFAPRDARTVLKVLLDAARKPSRPGFKNYGKRELSGTVHGCTDFQKYWSRTPAARRVV